MWRRTLLIIVRRIVATVSKHVTKMAGKTGFFWTAMQSGWQRIVLCHKMVSKRLRHTQPNLILTIAKNCPFAHVRPSISGCINRQFHRNTKQTRKQWLKHYLSYRRRLLWYNHMKSMTLVKLSFRHVLSHEKKNSFSAMYCHQLHFTECLGCTHHHSHLLKCTSC